MRKSSNQKKKYFNAIILKIKINAKIIHDGKNTTIFNKERINISAVPYHHLRRWVKFCIQSKYLIHSCLGPDSNSSFTKIAEIIASSISIFKATVFEDF